MRCETTCTTRDQSATSDKLLPLPPAADPPWISALLVSAAHATVLVHVSAEAPSATLLLPCASALGPSAGATITSTSTSSVGKEFEFGAEAPPPPDPTSTSTSAPARTPASRERPCRPASKRVVPSEGGGCAVDLPLPLPLRLRLRLRLRLLLLLRLRTRVGVRGGIMPVLTSALALALMLLRRP